MIKQARQLHLLWRFLGPAWLVQRVKYAVFLRGGLLRHRLPPRDWHAQPLAHFLREVSLADPEQYLRYRQREAPPFFFSTENRPVYAELLKTWDNGRTNPVTIADKVAEGILTYFAHAPVHVGFPPDWHGNPLTGQRTPQDGFCNSRISAGCAVLAGPASRLCGGRIKATGRARQPSSGL